uniref:BRCA1-associated RING domain protein 1 n=1 Tax=Brachionus koreanus TaxID=1199090 RepID=A0A482DJ45_9BILA|nr:BRCA1-associated RING domain protein 1 [Brachionus koreanus]
MDSYFSQTLLAAQDLKESFKCLNCDCIPVEPYFTGVCDHLLCKNCISLSNECPKCDAAFYQKDLHMNKMIKEAVLYINQIIEIVSPGYAESKTDSDILPSIDLNFDEKKSESKAFAVPEPVQLVATQTRSRSRKSTKAANSSQYATRSQSTRATRKSIQNENAEVDQSQKPRTQSAKRVRKNDKGETPLHLAVMNNDIEKLKELLAEPLVDVNSRDFAGWTPLHEAVNKDNIEMIKILIESNADINARGYQNNTPLHEATLNKRLDAIKFLLENGADHTVRNEFGVLAQDFVRDKPDFLSLFNKPVPKSPSPTKDISSSYVIRKSKVKTKKIVLYGSGMKDEEKTKMTQLASKFNIQIAREMGNNVTHVVFTTVNICARTINYMKAILMGIWIVNLKWLEDSFENNALLPENDYEAKGSVKIPDSNGPFKGRLNASAQSPKLFEDCFLYFYGEFNVFDKQDLIKLAEQAGAKILRREPKLERVDELITTEMPHHLDLDFDKNFSCSHFLIYDASKSKMDIKHKYLYSVKVNWLFACIDRFKILNPLGFK